ncbi:MAG: succinate dehydrogenase, cytochrome b556 subunit [Pseudomonadales bacterium]
MNKDHRPINVDPADLARFKWPIPALTSISHRIAGVVLFVGIAFGLYALDMSLSSEAGFERLSAMMASPLGMLVTFGLLAALSYHFVAGIKHLLLDLEIADSLKGGQFAAKATILFSAILIFLSAIWVTQG